MNNTEYKAESNVMNPPDLAAPGSDGRDRANCQPCFDRNSYTNIFLDCMRQNRAPGLEENSTAGSPSVPMIAPINRLCTDNGFNSKVTSICTTESAKDVSQERILYIGQLVPPIWESITHQVLPSGSSRHPCAEGFGTFNSNEQSFRNPGTSEVVQGNTTGRIACNRTSNYRGVTRHKWTKRYEAHLWDSSCRIEGRNRKGKQVYLGAYDTEEKAAISYDLAALKYWGRETTTNFDLSNYTQELEEMKNMTREEFVASLRRRSSGFSRGASIYRGVTRHRKPGRWQARIGRVADNKDLYLGTFGTQEAAAEAYDIAAIKYRGLRTVTNFDISRYDVQKILSDPRLCTENPAKYLKEGETSNSNVPQNSIDEENIVNLGMDILTGSAKNRQISCNDQDNQPRHYIETLNISQQHSQNHMRQTCLQLINQNYCQASIMLSNAASLVPSSVGTTISDNCKPVNEGGERISDCYYGMAYERSFVPWTPHLLAQAQQLKISTADDNNETSE